MLIFRNDQLTGTVCTGHYKRSKILRKQNLKRIAGQHCADIRAKTADIFCKLHKTAAVFRICYSCFCRSPSFRLPLALFCSKQYYRSWNRQQLLFFLQVHAAILPDRFYIGKQYRKRLFLPPFHLPQRLYRRTAIGRTGKMKAPDVLDRNDPAGPQAQGCSFLRFCFPQRCRFQFFCRIFFLPLSLSCSNASIHTFRSPDFHIRKRRSAIRTCNRLGMPADVSFSLIFSLTFLTECEIPHGNRRSVIWNPLEDTVTRTTRSTTDERITVSSVPAVQKLFPAARTSRQIRRKKRNFRLFCRRSARLNYERLCTSPCSIRFQNRIHPRALRLSLLKRQKELFHLTFLSLCHYGNNSRCIFYPSGNPIFFCKPCDKGAVSDSLYQPLYHNFFCRFLLCRFHHCSHSTLVNSTSFPDSVGLPSTPQSGHL